MGCKQTKHSSSEPEADAFRSDRRFLRPADCLKPRRAKKNRQLHAPPARSHRKVSKSTLRDWILDSPNLPDLKEEDELYVLRNSSQRVYSSSTVVSTIAGELLSVEQLLMLDHLAEKECCSAASVSSGQSREQKKRVRFKLPEETDIFLFYSPKQAEL